MTDEAPQAGPDRKELLMQAFTEAENVGTQGEQVQEVSPDLGQNTPETEPEAPIWTKPPASWKKDYHEPWSSLDPKVQEYVWQREDEMKAGVEPLKSKAQYAEQMQQALAPYMQTIQGLGLDPVKAVAGLMDADAKLRNLAPAEKKLFVGRLLASYGIDLNDAAPIEGAAVDPVIYELRNELTQVRGEVTGWKQQQQQAEDQRLLSEINEFASDAELFEDARPTMITLLQSGIADGISDAYEKAIRLDPALSEKAQQSQQAQADAEKRAAANKAAKAAKNAAVSVRSSSPGAPAATKAQDRRSMLEDQFSNIAERF